MSDDTARAVRGGDVTRIMRGAASNRRDFGVAADLTRAEGTCLRCRCKDGYEETGGRCVPAAARRSPAAVAAGGRGTDAGRGGGAGEYDALCQQQFGEFAEFDGVDSCR